MGTARVPVPKALWRPLARPPVAAIKMLPLLDTERRRIALTGAPALGCAVNEAYA